MSVELKQNENTYDITEWGVEMPPILNVGSFLNQTQNQSIDQQQN